MNYRLKIIDMLLSASAGALLSATFGLTTVFTLTLMQCAVGWKLLDIATRMYGTYTYNKWLESQISNSTEDKD